jgi:hypothetical protein
MDFNQLNNYNRNDNSYIVNTYNSTISDFISSINNIENTNNGVNTQLTASQHENKCRDIICRSFNTTSLNKELFRKFISDNGRSWCGHGNNSIIKMCDVTIHIYNNSLNIEYNKNYLIEQPSGGQNFPDMCMIRLDVNNDLQITMIECKQLIPKFNNNPPKMKENCIYICGNKMYNGYLLTTPEWQEKKENYIQRYKDLVNEFSDEELNIVSYKVIELNWRRGCGPLCYQERRDQNIPLITRCLSRYI